MKHAGDHNGHHSQVAHGKSGSVLFRLTYELLKGYGRYEDIYDCQKKALELHKLADFLRGMWISHRM